MREMLKNLPGLLFQFPLNLTWPRKRNYVLIGLGIAILLLTQSLCFEPDAVVQSSPTESPSPLDSRTVSDALIVVDHISVALFEQMPDEYIQAAENLRMVFYDRSVGENIHGALEDCLSHASDEEAPLKCKNPEHGYDSTFSVDPSELDWYRSGGYNPGNWEYVFWPQPGCSDWYGKVDCFITMTEPIIDQYDVVSFQLSYLAVGSGSTVINQPGGYFWDNATLTDVYDQEAFEALHPDKAFIYWTTSLARSIGTPESETFNNQMRQYASDNNKILFDVADILSHDPDGNPCYDDRDGVPYTGSNGSENYPDDGLDIPAICQHYTTEVNQGHLATSAAKIRIAKAFWVLMAQIAGWEPGSAPTSPRIQSVTPTNGYSDVLLNEPLVINFSEEMLTSSVTYSLAPNSGGIVPTWNSNNTQLTLTHNNFIGNTVYTVSVTTGTDLDGNQLNNAPFTWAFTTGSESGPEADLSIKKKADISQSVGGCYGCLITYTLTISNAGPTSPITATVQDQWSPTEAVNSAHSLPGNCMGYIGSGIITCSNVVLTGATPVELEVVLQTAIFTDALALQNEAVVTITNPQVIDPPADNVAATLVIINPLRVNLPVTMKE